MEKPETNKITKKASNKIKSLGRGINALLPNPSLPSNPKNSELFGSLEKDHNKIIIEINLKELSANPFQPRIHFDQEKLEELATSIKSYGILEPVLVTKNKDGEGYTIVAGERRLRAATIAEIETIPAIVLSLEDEQKIEIAISENLQRENLNPIETALSFKIMMNIRKITQLELAKKLGVSRPFVSNLIRLLTLPTYIQEAIQKEKITQSHARLLLSVDTDQQKTLFNKIIYDNLSVKEVEKRISPIKQRTTSNEQTTNKKDLSAYKQHLIEFFGTKVEIFGNINKGSITINYYTQDDFSRILELLNITLH